MNSIEEKKLEEDIDSLFMEDPIKAKYLMETNWKYYNEYFFRYFGKNIKKDNSKVPLLDVGCGAGILAGELKKYGFDIYGVDFSTKAIELAKDQNPGINFQQSTIYKLPFPDESFDFTICLGVFQTVADYKSALKEMSRVMKKGGIMVIRTLSSISLSFYKTKRDNPTFLFYNPFAFKKDLENAGFNVKNIKGVYLAPSKLSFLTDFFLKNKAYDIFNFFFPITSLVAHSFYIEAVKK